ncbi:MAG: type IIL restriction-modification enzyme MmeI [bacterium]
MSYRALDVEQIGHVYEGLLEHTAARVPTITLGLAGSKNAKNPNLPLSELESARMDGDETLIALAMETTERSQSAICNALTRLPEEVAFGRLLSVCGGDTVLAERIRPFVNLLRTDAWDDPIVYRGNAFMITLGADRRETGTHYTPKSRTESIVQTTLEPVVYIGPAEGKPREEWRLKRPGELLDLKICDLGMGSGAFLVQTCRWLAERLVEAWAIEEATGKFIITDGNVRENVDDFDPMPLDMEERLLMARRLIAERCLYGVDVNPLAVELTKLSIWLVTLAKGRPFGFLDHNLRHGDSLLGIHCLDQLIKFKMNPDYSPHQQHIFGQNIEKAVVEAVEIRKRLRSIPIRDIRDVEMMTRLDKEARDKLQVVKLVADAMIGQVLCSNGNTRILDSALESLVMEVDEFLNGSEKMGLSIAEKARIALSVDLPYGKLPRKPFHWPLEFPEVFAASSSGFTGIVGNPPFMYGKNISGNFGESYSNYLLSIHPWSSKNADLCVHFFLRSFNLLQIDNSMGLLATKTIAEGDSRESGLEWITSNGGEIFAAFPNEPWPGRAAVITSRVHVIKGSWLGLRRLMSSKVDFISSYLTDQKLCTPKPLKENMGIAFQGSTILGEGHILTKTEALSLIDQDERNRKVLFPYLNGDELNSDSQQQPSRWVINFYDWEEHCAAGYTKVYELLKDQAYPDRLEKSKKKSYKTIMKSWWQYWRPRSDLYHAIGRGHDYRNHINGWDLKIRPFDRVLVIARTSKTGAFVFIPNSYVMSDAMVVFARSDYLFFSILQSNIHVAYAWQYSSKLKADLRYSHSDCFETFPFPEKSKCNTVLEKVGEQFHSTRDAFLKANRVGLTGFYQRFHNPTDKDPELNNLRDLQITLDKEVLKAYEFEDIDPGHNFHPVAYLPEDDRIRFTINEQARLEVLHRLARINDDRYTMETSAIYRV